MKIKSKKALVVLLFLSCPFFLFACSSGSSDSGAVVSSGGGEVVPFDDGPDASGIFTINTSGADGGPDGGFGGDGGYVRIYMDYGSMGALQVMASGAADAGFTPSLSIPDLGDNPLNITADTTIAVATVEPAAGTPYLVALSSLLRISDGNGALSNEPPVTGISVAAGTTLTLGLNYTTYAWISLSNDIDNDGTITTGDIDATQRGNLLLTLASYHGNSTIDTSGTLDGQHGGYVQINPNYSFFNHGSIDTSGADSTTGAGGDGGYVSISAYNGIENTGNITADGGTTSAIGAPGGYAGSLDFVATFSIFNSGNLSCRGGDGVESGGVGGDMYFSIDTIGNLHNSGDLDTSGGVASGPGFGGGLGGGIAMYAYGGEIVNSGNLTTKGGDTTDPSSDGGSGGSIFLWAENTFFGPTPAPAGDILFSGNVDTSGGLAVAEAGATGSGGSGGDFEIVGYYEYLPLGQQIALLGYAGIAASGGSGMAGGSGGYVELYCDYNYNYMTGGDTPSCNITNEAAIDATGGSVLAAATTPAYGGSGGSVDIWTDEVYGMFDPEIDKVVNKGNIDTSGGDSLEADFPAGIAGYVWIWGFNGVTNSGNITAGGGHDLGTNGGTTGIGSDGNDLQLYAGLGPVSNSGNLTTNGGDGEYSGGYASVIELFGSEVSNSGALAANGGDADPSLAGSAGGDGADVELFSPDGLQGITQTGTVTNDGGTGATPGSDGNYYLGVLVP